MLKDPDRVIGIARDKLGMGPPAPENVVRLDSRPLARAAAPRRRRQPGRASEAAGVHADHALDARPHRRLRRRAGRRCSWRSASARSRCRCARPTGCAAWPRSSTCARSSCRRGAAASSTATAPSWRRRRTSIRSTATRASCPTRATPRAGWRACWGSTAPSWRRSSGQRRFFAWVKRKVTPDEVDGGARRWSCPASRSRASRAASIRTGRWRRRSWATPGSDGQRPRGDRAGAGQAAARHVVVGAGDARRARARHRSSRATVDGAEHRRQRRRADDRSLPDVHHRARAGGAARAEHHAKAAIAIMMDPRTGEVLAMASVPTYNPNDPGRRRRGGRAQPRHHRHLRARLDDEDVHDRGRAGRGRGASPTTASTA